jgi:uncharacterized protein YdiU (UPF0061 family)
MVERLFELMFANHTDFTLTFRRLCEAAVGTESDDEVRSLFADAGGFDSWVVEWRKRLKQEPNSPHERARSMRMANPAFIPRNHLVEAALKAASEHRDYQPFEQLLDAVSRPYEERPDLERYTMPARPEERVTQTFCGT